MAFLQGIYLAMAFGIVLYVYRSTLVAVVRENGRVLQLWRPGVVLVVAYISGLNVPVIAGSSAHLVSPAWTEPFWYLVTLAALPALSWWTFLSPAGRDM